MSCPVTVSIGNILPMLMKSITLMLKMLIVFAGSIRFTTAQIPKLSAEQFRKKNTCLNPILWCSPQKKTSWLATDVSIVQFISFQGMVNVQIKHHSLRTWGYHLQQLYLVWCPKSPSSLGHQSQAFQSFHHQFSQKTGWWFGTCVIFPYIGNNHPNWLSYFSERFKPPIRYSSYTYTYIIYYIYISYSFIFYTYKSSQVMGPVVAFHGSSRCLVCRLGRGSPRHGRV